MNAINPIRPSPIAGSWYSADRSSLAAEIKEYINHAVIPRFEDPVIGLIAPHAGYFYSGETAGYSYRCVQGLAFDLCVVISPLHAYLPHPLLTSAHSAYATPLGQVEVAQDLITALNQRLDNDALPILQPIANDREHSLEIQLPFLQIGLVGDFKLLPIMVRTNDSDMLQKTAHALAEVLKNTNTLIIASTDLSHFYNDKTANSFDEVMLNYMTGFSPEGVLEAELDQEGFACGAGAVALVLWTTKRLGAKNVHLLHHSTSAKASGDTSSVVGYGALAITG
ncbi:MAG: hypothetical protein FD147_1377 [Chloroflexi bacterium]|nr:MAG: hypothetical protein FD147_1377 [Chloroflexota bacterium]